MTTYPINQSWALFTWQKIDPIKAFRRALRKRHTQRLLASLSNEQRKDIGLMSNSQFKLNRTELW